MSAPTINLTEQAALVAVGFMSGIMTTIGTLISTWKKSQTEEKLSLEERVSEMWKDREALLQSNGVKERETLEALDGEARARAEARDAVGRQNLLLNEIATLKWRQGVFYDVVQELMEEIKLTPVRRQSILNRLRMDAPAGIADISGTCVGSAGQQEAERLTR